jgi:hypothetical protein
MNRILRGAALLVAAVTTYSGLSVASASAKPVTPSEIAAPSLFASSCLELHTRRPWLGDGRYILASNNKIFTVHCHDMAGSPREYLNLARVGPNQNFSQYTAGGSSRGTDVRTSFTKLRINPSTLVVDIGDLTFSTSVGELRHVGGPMVTSMAYGVAMACVQAFGTEGRANIDLQGMPFSIDNGFVGGGWLAAGSATISDDNKRADIVGGGLCGWHTPAPAMYNPFNPSPGDFHLKLKCVSGVSGTQYCLDLDAWPRAR